MDGPAASVGEVGPVGGEGPAFGGVSGGAAGGGAGAAQDGVEGGGQLVEVAGGEAAGPGARRTARAAVGGGAAGGGQVGGLQRDQVPDDGAGVQAGEGGELPDGEAAAGAVVEGVEQPGGDPT